MKMPPDSVVRWLAGGERGISSETIVGHLYGIPLNQFGPDHPYDPDDWQRCARLLAACPEVLERFGEMATASPTWARLVKRWDEIDRTFREEVGDDWMRLPSLRGKTAPRTYDLIKQILRAADKSSGEEK